MTSAPPKVVWQPLPGAQALALSCPCDVILLDGDRGGGKSDAQLMMFRRHVGLGYGTHWRGLIYDREYKNLDSIILTSKRWFYSFNDGAKFLSGGGQLKWVWPTGEELLFRAFAKPEDYWSIHGSQFSFLGPNELTKYPSPDLLESIMSTNRSSFVPELHSPDLNNPLPEIPLMLVATTNPYGAGHSWVKQKFVDPAPAGVIVENKLNVYNPRTQQRDTVTKTQVRIRTTHRENTYLSPEYIASLEAITDKNKREAWLNGSWDITSGGMFDDVWSSQYNIVQPFDIPASWRIDRSFDWGSSAPFSVGWWAESDGSDVQLADGTWRSTIKGDLFRIAEWYGWNGTPNKGLRMLARQIAKGIVERELSMKIRSRVQAGPADNSINDEVNGECIAKQMAEPVTIASKRHKGVTWTRSDKSPGSRKAGWEKMRDAICNAQPSESGYRERPGLFVFRTCQEGFIRTVPPISRDEKDLDDISEKDEDHCFAGDTKVLTEFGGVTFRALAEAGTQGCLHTDKGLHEFRSPRMTRRDAELVRVTFSDGSYVRCTPEHKFMVADGSWVEARYLIEYSLKYINTETLRCKTLKLSARQCRNSWVLGTTCVATTIKTRAADCIEQFGSLATGLYPMDTMYTTKTMIGQTIACGTLKCFPQESIWPFTKKCSPPSSDADVMSTLSRARKRLLSGTDQSSVLRGIVSSMRSIAEGRLRRLNYVSSVKSAGQSLGGSPQLSSVVTPAKLRLGCRAVSTMFNRAVFSAQQSLLRTSTQKRSHVREAAQENLRAVAVEPAGRGDVYCLTVPALGRFALANGAVVKNCADESRYRVLATGSRFSTGRTSGLV